MKISKALCVTVLSVLAMSDYASAAKNISITRDEDMERKIEAILSRMTLEEKIGQMTQLSVEVLGDIRGDKFILDPEKVRNAISVYKVGSILNTPGGTLALSTYEWYDLISQLQEISIRETGIPCIYGLDQNHGTSYARGGILFPQNINIGASFNKSLAYDAATITAYETRAGDCPWTFSPTIDLTRDPRWSRVWENFGEDPLVNAVMGVNMVRGFQGNDPNKVDNYHIAATLKHYLGYGAARTGKDRTPAYISPSELREKYFEPYRACIEAGALSVMVNSGSINGQPVHANAVLLTEWLKRDMHWDGMIVTDWADIDNLHNREKVAADKKEAIEMAINAGIDMSMDPYNTNFCTLLKELVEECRVSMERIDDATRRVLRLKYRLGLFDTPNTNPENYPDYHSEAYRRKAIEIAEESEILLKNNNNLLPLKESTRILVTGPNANSMRALNGGWSYSWQGNAADMYASEYNTIYEALVNKFGRDNVILEQGVRYDESGNWDAEMSPEIDKALKAAESVDVILACIGENSYCETPGNLNDLALSENQRNLVKALAASGKPIILILNEGRPRIISAIEPLADAVIDILLPGNFGGDALANILTGEANPSAKMPYTYPRYPAALTTYDYKVSEEVEKMDGAYDYDAVVSVLYPFGYGKSYTTFAYDNLVCSTPVFKKEDNLIFKVNVTNTGKVKGKEVVLLFSSDKVASLVPDNRRLRAFEKIELAPRETKTVTLEIPASDLAFVGADGKWILEKGDFRIQVGNKTLDIRCEETYKWTTPNR